MASLILFWLGSGIEKHNIFPARILLQHVRLQEVAWHGGEEAGEPHLLRGDDHDDNDDDDDDDDNDDDNDIMVYWLLV